MLVFLNGQFVPEGDAVVSVQDRGFLYGDGLFETARVCKGRAFRFAQHLERMMRGAEFLQIRSPFSARELQQFAKELIEKNNQSEAVLRVALSRGPGERGYTPRHAEVPNVVMTLHSTPPLEPGRPPEWTMITSAHRIAANDALASFKHSSKLLQVVARLEATAKGAEEALLLNTQNEVAEAAGGNLFWLYQGKVCTTPTGRGVLPGISRAVVLEICQNLGLPTNKRIIKRESLANADAIFLTQSAFGIISITALDGEIVPHDPLVETIHQQYCEMLGRE